MPAIAVLTVIRIWYRRLPGTIVIFAAALVAGRGFDFAGAGMQVIGPIDTTIPVPAPSGLTVDQVPQLIIAAIGLAFLVFPEGVLLGRAMAGRQGYAINPDRELVALGAANLAAGLFQSFSVGSSQTRTLLNSASGGRTQMVSFVAAALMVAFVYFLASWIATLPAVAIGAILVFTGFTLIDVRVYAKLKAQHRFSAMLALLTSAAVIGLGVLPGILLGVSLSVLHLLGQVVRPQDALLGRVPGSETLHDIGDDDAAQTIPGLVVYRFYGPLVFANVRFFCERLEDFVAQEDSPVRQVVLDARAIPEIDVTAAEQLRTFITKLEKQGIHSSSPRRTCRCAKPQFAWGCRIGSANRPTSPNSQTRSQRLPGNLPNAVMRCPHRQQFPLAFDRYCCNGPRRSRTGRDHPRRPAAIRCR